MSQKVFLLSIHFPPLSDELSFFPSSLKLNFKFEFIMVVFSDLQKQGTSLHFRTIYLSFFSHSSHICDFPGKMSFPCLQGHGVPCLLRCPDTWWDTWQTNHEDIRNRTKSFTPLYPWHPSALVSLLLLPNFSQTVLLCLENVWTN